MPETVISGRGLSYIYRSRREVVEAVREVDITCYRSQLTLLSGRSGSGKSSLFFLLAGMLRPTAGELEVLGRRLDHLGEDARGRLRRAQLALMFQAYNLFPTLSAFENVAYPLRRERAQGIADTVMAALERVGVAHRARQRPDRLSGGEQQRVALARALVQKPRVLLADEPTGALDPTSGAVVMQTLREIANDPDSAVVMISHDRTSEVFADQHLIMENGRIRHA